MKQLMRVALLLALLGLGMFVFSSQTLSQAPSQPGLDRLRQDTGGQVEITWNATGDRPSFIRGAIPLSALRLQGKADPSAIALAIAGRYADLFGVKQAAQELKVVGSDVDALGMTHVTLAQVYQGIAVYGATMKVHLSVDGVQVVAISSDIVPNLRPVETQPATTAVQAAAAAQKYLPKGAIVTSPRLVVYAGAGNPSGLSARLAWLVELADDAVPAHAIYVMDARDAVVLDVLDRLYAEQLAAPQTASEPLKLLSDGQFPYGPNVAGFSVSDYLDQQKSGLAAYANLIEDRAEWYSINPRLLLALLEVQDKSVTAAPERVSLAIKPFADRIEQLATSLVTPYYARLYRPADDKSPATVRTLDGQTIRLDGTVNAGTLAVAAALAQTSNSSALATLLDKSAAAGFLQTYTRLFPGSDPLDESNHIELESTPPVDMLQLPFAVDDTWTFMQGPHDFSGNDSEARSFIDIGIAGSHGAVAGRWVTAAAGGTVTRHTRTQGTEDCWVDITHSNGWKTVYYHVANLQVNNGDPISQNAHLGNPSELTCNGGAADGSHVHFGVQQPSGVYAAISGTILSGWKVVETGLYAGYLDGPWGYSRRNESDTVINHGVCGPGRYKAEYFNNRTLTGNPAFVRCEDAPIAYNWGASGPGNGLSNDNFSIRWTGWFTFAQDTYSFFTRADDGNRIWVDDVLLMDDWRDQTAHDGSATRAMTRGEHKIKVEYYEHIDVAMMDAVWWPNSVDTDDGQVVRSGQTVWARLNPNSDTDTFYFDGVSGQRATIWMTQQIFSGLDSFVTLYAPNGAEVAHDDDNGGNRNSFINQAALAQTGRYRIVAKSYAEGSGGLYTLQLLLQQRGVVSRKVCSAAHGTDLPGTICRNEGDPPTSDVDVDLAYDNLGLTHSYFWGTHTRGSYDDAGGAIIATVHYGANYLNAYWDGSQFVFGDSFPVKDVVAHEFTHGVTQYSANLEYRWQSGALNESFSDIFAAMIDRDDWLIGDELPDDVLGGRDAIRDMSNPARLGQPANTQDWVSTCSDNEGVHTNSGIFNAAFYTITVGTQSRQALGKDRAEKIFYRALTSYLSSGSGFEAARSAVLQATADLSITLGYQGAYTTVYNAVRDGFNAVGLDGLWQPATNCCSCGSCSALAGGATAPAGRPSTLAVLSDLRAVRDQVFSTSAVGQYWIDTYYKHLFQVGWLILSKPELRTEALDGYSAFDPVFRALLAGDKAKSQVILTPELIGKAERVLMGIAKTGSPELRNDIVREWERVNPYRFAGWEVNKVWQKLQSEKPTLQ